jgi:glycosyltransferase involved in cell wall biosynthesis
VAEEAGVTENDRRAASGTPTAGGVAIELAFVGTVVPDRPEFRNAAFSRAGNLYQERFLAGLAANGHAPSLVVSAMPCPSFPGSRTLFVRGSGVALDSGVPVSLVPYLNVTPLKQLSVGWSASVRLVAWAWRARGRKRIIYTYNLSVPPGLLTLVAARLCGAKLVAALCDINIPGETVPPTWWHRVDYWLHRFVLPRLDGIVTITDSIVEDFAPRVPSLRLEGGVAPEAIRPVRHQRSGPEPFVIVAAGTLNAANGTQLILDAFRLLSGDGYRLRMAGDGPLRSAVARAAEADPRIEYLGLVSHDRVAELYASADVLLNIRLTKDINTRYFFPSKLMEYLASGVPVVTTCAAHIEEEYGPYVFLVRDEVPAGVAETIRRVQADPDGRRERARAALDYVASHKTWDAQARRVWEFLGAL